MKRTITTVAISAAAVSIIGAGTSHADTIAKNTEAQNSFASQLGVATAVGGIGGTAIGAAIGCGVGGIVTAPTIVFIPAGCATGALAGAGIGGLVGTLVVGGPTLLIGGVMMVQVLLTPSAE